MGGIPVRFTPLYGVHGGQPLCYLLELGGVVILLDCGWNDHYDPALLRPLQDVLDHVDVGEQQKSVRGGVGGHQLRLWEGISVLHGSNTGCAAPCFYAPGCRPLLWFKPTAISSRRCSSVVAP